jgi:hypothetical protein
VPFADGRSGAEAAWAYGLLYRRSMQRALDEVHPKSGVLFGRSGWTGQQAVGVTWGGDQASDFWSLEALVAATLTAAASGYSNWSHDVGGYLGERLVARCPRELLLRWVQFGCFTPLMHAHGRVEQEAWTYDAETLDIYRDYVLLHERLLPYVRASGDGCAHGPPDHPPAAALGSGRRARLVARGPVRLRPRAVGRARAGARCARALWGDPPLGHTAVRLADGTRIGWRRGEWAIPPGRVVSVARR